MNIYLDVDGVLISNGKPANGLNEFIEYLDANYRGNVFWLTTHCQGSTDSVMSYLRRFVNDFDTIEALERIKPTKWNTAKTEGIDLSEAFLWFDDNLLYGEKQALTDNEASENVILVNLKEEPDTLLSFVRDFLLPV